MGDFIFIAKCRVSFFMRHGKTTAVGESGVGEGLPLEPRSGEAAFPLSVSKQQQKTADTCVKPFGAMRSLEPWAI